MEVSASWTTIRMITVGSEIQLDYVFSKEKPELSPQYIRQISAEKRPFMSVVTKYALENSMLIEPRDLQALAESSRLLRLKSYLRNGSDT